MGNTRKLLTYYKKGKPWSLRSETLTSKENQTANSQSCPQVNFSFGNAVVTNCTPAIIIHKITSHQSDFQHKYCLGSASLISPCAFRTKQSRR